MVKPNISFYISIALIAIVIIYIQIAKGKLHRNGILLNGKTLEWSTASKVTVVLKYEFWYNGEKFKGDNPFNDFRGNTDFVGHYFPVVYYPKMGGHSQLLIRPRDFEEYNLPFPDSLKWVLPYLKE